jgi:hypothetical protein
MTAALTITQQLQAVREWQEAGVVHELTCGVDSQKHPPLEARLLRETKNHGSGNVGEEHVILVCVFPHCIWAQDFIPESIFMRYRALRAPR